MSGHLTQQHCTVSSGRARSRALCCKSSPSPDPGFRGHTAHLAEFFVWAAAPCGDATDSATDLIALSVKELKALAKEAGVDITGCAEKSEIVQCLQDVHKPPGAAGVAGVLILMCTCVSLHVNTPCGVRRHFQCVDCTSLSAFAVILRRKSHASWGINCHFDQLIVAPEADSLLFVA